MAMKAIAIRFEEEEKDWIQSYASVLGISFGSVRPNLTRSAVRRTSDYRTQSLDNHSPKTYGR